MLNWAARYYPIIRTLKLHNLFDQGSLLEIGSGSTGIGRFRKVPFVGCDLTFPVPPEWPMLPLSASAARLPMKDRQFDVVLASDVLEHIPPDLRPTVIEEALRVARKLVIFGFPCGQVAWESDRALYNTYLNEKREPPGWLAEHMEAPFPETDLFQAAEGWTIALSGNENLRFHAWLMRQEMSYRFVRASMAAMRAAPSLLEFLLRQADGPPCYRQIVTLLRPQQN
jgi:Methyltransferase domain